MALSSREVCKPESEKDIAKGRGQISHPSHDLGVSWTYHEVAEEGSHKRGGQKSLDREVVLLLDKAETNQSPWRPNSCHGSSGADVRRKGHRKGGGMRAPQHMTKKGDDSICRQRTLGGVRGGRKKKGMQKDHRTEGEGTGPSEKEEEKHRSRRRGKVSYAAARPNDQVERPSATRKLLERGGRGRGRGRSYPFGIGGPQRIHH